MTAAHHLVDHLRALAADRPDDVALVVIGESDDTPISYRALDERVRALAACLQQRFAPGERALLLLDNDDHYVVAFLACQYAGLVAVPAFPPESMRPQHLARLAAIADDARAACVLATRDLLLLLGNTNIADARVMAVDDVALDDACAWRPRTIRDDDIAFLQYTSGSTSSPKGVMVSHGNLMANERAIERGMAVGTDDVFVSWLPLYHDMGLIGGLLQPLHRGIPLGLMTPKRMLERPLRWLQAITRLRATISGGPDFAFRLCVDRVKATQLAGLDLSCWRVAFSGAEPIRSDTLRAFARHFEPAGFDADALFPCYGLAEATLFVSGAARGEGAAIGSFHPASVARGSPRACAPSPEAHELVACGTPAVEHIVAIVDAASLQDLPDDTVGEIWAAGPSIAQGYWRRADATAATFVERAGTRWLRTGDLGFRRDGRLYVTGRLKDLVIVRGHNVYPQDIERAVESAVDAVRAGRAAAFAVDGPDGEGIGLAAEVGRATQKRLAAGAIVDRLSAAVAEQCGEAPVVIVLLNPGALPRTSSGKLQRAACRQGWSQGSLDAWTTWERGRFVGEGQASSAPTADSALDGFERELAALWRDVLPADTAGDIDRDTHFLGRGGNSLMAVRLCALASARWNVTLPTRIVFEQPRLAAMASEIRRLRDASASARQAISRLPDTLRQDPLPASHAQERQWFLWRLDPTSTAYNIGGALRLDGPLDPAVLGEAIDTLFERHESLRTVFSTDASGAVCQAVQPARPGRLDAVDLRALPPHEREARASAFAQDAFDRPFDLRAGPLARITLLRLADETHLLVVALHHIAGDAASFDILLGELGRLYAARVDERDASPLAPLSIQPADHAAWQRARLAEGEEARQLAYWLGQLAGEQPVLALPTRSTRDATGPTERRVVALPIALTDRLRSFAASHEFTPFMILLAAFQALLHRNTGQEDIRVGVPVSLRQQPEVAGLVGLFVNTMVLRARVHGGLRFAELLAQVREAVLNAQAHADLPFERLVAALRPERHGETSPLFQVMFNHLREEPSGSLSLPDIDVRPHPLRAGAAQFELTLDTVEHADGRVSATISHAPGRFRVATIDRLCAEFVSLLAAVVDRPQGTLGNERVLGDADLARLRAWSTPPDHAANAEPVHRTIERQARLRPDAIALSLDEHRLTFSQLDAASNRLAHRLVALGARPDDRIGLALERSIELVVALLATLKACAAYVPLDPQYPVDRLALMIEDSGVGLVLARAPHAVALARAGVNCLDIDTLALDHEPGEAPAVEVHGEHLAYVIHTSGSTGRPKGVGVAHRALAAHTRVARELFGLTPADRVLQFATPNFDGFVEQLFPALCAGAQVVLRGPELWDAARFHREVAARGITVADLTTAYWQFLAQEAEAHGAREPGSLRLVHAGGEAMSVEGLRAWQTSGFARVALRNTYGPTEACVTATALDCTQPAAEVDTACLSLGRPLAGRALHVVDADLNLVAPGVAGELCIGGTLLARGYVGRGALTAERFVADPFAADDARLYRTGDLVRWSEDGRLDYLGRIDHQVKIRGFRVELGEIEAQLLAQPEVDAAVVVARPGRDGAALVAYVAPAVASTAVLRERLARALPDYMLPSAIVALATLPLNLNGKIDRHALPAPAAADDERVTHAPPMGADEAALAALWCETLGVERVGRHDNFFERGGHSLAAIRIAALWSQRRGGELPLRAFFETPTVAGVAAQLAAPATDFAVRLAAMDELLDEFES